MAHFQAIIKGNRGETSRLGSKGSGMDATIRGWDIGVKVYAYYDEKDKCDKIRIQRTKGSNNSTITETIEFTEDPQTKLTRHTL